MEGLKVKNNEILLEAVIKTLDTIQVQGRDNMQKIMSCITVLEKVIYNDTSGIVIEGENKDLNKDNDESE